MKKFVLFLFVAAVLVACNNKPGSSLTNAAMYQDTAGLAAFQSWKAQLPRPGAGAYAMPVNDVQRVPSNPVRHVQTRVIEKAVPVAAPVAVKKKGWSKGAKGAVIGTAGGALAGVLINKKNRLAGGIIGGVVGGGLGYVIGHGMDKKDGR